MMVISLVDNSMFWLNAFPSTNGMSYTMSPERIVQEKQTVDMNIKRIFYGSFAMVFISTKNKMSRMIIPAIALNQSNMHGGHYFMSLYTGKRLHSYEWNELPISDEVVDIVEALAEEQKARLMADGYPMLEWSLGVPIIDKLEENNDDIKEEIENEEILEYEDENQDGQQDN